jgi:hypothetical protein
MRYQTLPPVTSIKPSLGFVEEVVQLVKMAQKNVKINSGSVLFIFIVKYIFIILCESKTLMIYLHSKII